MTISLKIELDLEEWEVDALRRYAKTYPQPRNPGFVEQIIHAVTHAVPPRSLVAGDIVRSNADKTIQGTVLGVSGGYVCFDTGNSHGYGNPFRIMLAELLERV